MYALHTWNSSEIAERNSQTTFEPLTLNMQGCQEEKYSNPFPNKINECEQISTRKEV